MNYWKRTSLISTIFVVLGITAPRAEAALLVASGMSGEILKYDENTGDFIETFISKGTGGLQIPLSLEIGPDENLYITDVGDNTVKRYNLQTGDFIDALVASGSGGLTAVEGLAFDPNGDFLFTSGFLGDGIRRFDAQTGDFIDILLDTVPSTGNELNSASVTSREDGTLFFGAIFPTAGVLSYDLETGTTTTFIDVDDAPSVPGGLIFGPDGDLYVNDFSPEGSVTRYDGETGELIDILVEPGSGGLNGASRLAFNDDFLYVTSTNTSSVLRYDAETGDFIDAFVPSGSGGLNAPAGLLFSPESIAEPASSLGILFLGMYLSSYLLKKKLPNN